MADREDAMSCLELLGLGKEYFADFRIPASSDLSGRRERSSRFGSGWIFHSSENSIRIGGRLRCGKLPGQRRSTTSAAS